VTELSTAWEKTAASPKLAAHSQRRRFLLGGVAILVAIGFLIVNGTLSNAQYFITVDELFSRSELTGQNVRISGAVDGDTISYDSDTLTIRFMMANIPEETENLAQTLHDAVTNPDASRIQVVVENQPMPDLLQNEAQAIVTGSLGPDGVFHADELLLKCPTRYEEAIPNQIDEASAG